MKKLKLDLADLEVSTFAADAAGGSVHGMDAITQGCISGYWTCDCTLEVGCYASKWCSGEGCVLTTDPGCETSNEFLC